MGLVNVAYLEALLGYDISTDDEPKIQAYIEMVSSFIEDYTGRSFSTHEDVAVVAVADGRGMIEIADLQSITSVEQLDQWTNTYGGLSNFYGNSGYAFDGIEVIYGLCPHVTYRVTATYGFAAVPEDIKNIVALLVLAATGLDVTAVNGLKSYRVGDVEESYGVSTNETGEPQVTLSSLMTHALNGYATGTTTYRL